ncbi:carbon-nitrogen hydrolase [Collybia nuda]|uniref:Carbon-nitrogen hydrolase n=1 Tax=Collybia nuda TaxID=64659 RepID=A0A9P5YF51_9AGAR|nr:carbon-nitrogen hydrolase [Collybia nuda]
MNPYSPGQNKIRASVVQSCAAAYSLDATLDKLEYYTRLAKNRDNSQLAVFPEAFVGGYPKLSSFGVALGYHSPQGRDEFLRYHSAAIEIPSPAVTRIENISKETGVFLVVGIVERDQGTLYCTVIFVDPEEGYIAKHRKVQPTVVERVIWGQGNGSTLPVLQRNFKSANDEERTVKAKVSATICWENFMPLPPAVRTFYYSQGTQLYCVPTIDSRPEWQPSMIHIAVEGRCFVLSACQYAEEKDYPPDHAVADENHRSPDNVMIAGGSVIVSPLGKVLAGPLYDEEGVLTAELDMDDCIRGKFDLDVVGHYARPEIFELRVNQEDT